MGYQLGYVYLVWWLLYLTRQYLMISSNGARSPAGIDRPDQHAYEDQSGKAVAMTTTGSKGRFNRAQRAAYNMDESLPLFSTGILAVTVVFGPVAPLPAVISMYGRITFGNLYRQSAQGRMAGFMPSMIAEMMS